MAASAIIATPMSPPAPKQEPSHRLVDDQQVQLAAMTTPIRIHGTASNPQAVHVLADVSRAFQLFKVANATPAVGTSAASSSPARTKVAPRAAAAAIPSQANATQTGAVTQQHPETDNSPSAAGGQSLIPRSAAVNAFDPSGVPNVLASAAQLVIDVNIALPARVIEATASNLDDFVHDAAGNPFDLVGALSRFLTTEGDTISNVGDVFSHVVSDDTEQLQNAINGVFGVNQPDERVASAKTATEPGATAASPVSGVVDKTTAAGMHSVDAHPKAAATGKHSQEGTAKPVTGDTPGQKGDTGPANQSGTEIKDQSPSTSTDATKNEAAKDDASKGDTATPRSQSTSTSQSEVHNGVSSSANNATKKEGATKAQVSTHTPSRTSSHAANSGSKHSGASGAAGGHSGKGSHGGK
ncbi:hypothetical protein [Mycobacterium sp. URHB0021]